MIKRSRGREARERSQDVRSLPNHFSFILLPPFSLRSLCLILSFLLSFLLLKSSKEFVYLIRRLQGIKVVASASDNPEATVTNELCFINRNYISHRKWFSSCIWWISDNVGVCLYKMCVNVHMCARAYIVCLRVCVCVCEVNAMFVSRYVCACVWYLYKCMHPLFVYKRM